MYKMIQDHKGYMWMATNLGLIRYNGIEVEKIYKKLNDTYNGTGEVKALLVDPQGDIWMGSNSGLNKYNPNCDCLIQYPLFNADSTSTGVESMTEDKNQNLWLGTYNGELLKFSKENKSIW